jgi:hypothetical protein
MKRRISREINVFNMSMLDVICCALGAFVILILMADFNRSEAVQTVKKLQDEIRHYAKTSKKVRKENTDLKDKNAQLEKDKAQLQGENDNLKEKLAQDGQEQGEKKDLKDKLALCEHNNEELRKKTSGNLEKKIRVWGDPRKTHSGEAITISGFEVTRFRTQNESGRQFGGRYPCYKRLRECKEERMSEDVCTTPFGSRKEVQ